MCKEGLFVRSSIRELERVRTLERRSTAARSSISGVIFSTSVPNLNPLTVYVVILGEIVAENGGRRRRMGLTDFYSGPRCRGKAISECRTPVLGGDESRFL